MIIECINCNKIFEVNSELIPSKGRTIQCGACNHTWFYTPNQSVKKEFNQFNNIKKKTTKTIKGPKPSLRNKTLSNEIDKIINKKDKALIKYEKKPFIKFTNFFGYIVVFIITFLALIIILDTFQTKLTTIFPDLELFLYNLYELMEDIFLFIKDLLR